VEFKLIGCPCADVRPTPRPLPGRQRNNSTSSSESTSAHGEVASFLPRPEPQDANEGGGGGGGGGGPRRGAHRKPCRRYESRRAGCLNGGRCFVVELHNGLRRPGCRYHVTYTPANLHLTGLRGTVVERRSLAGRLSPSHARPAADG